MSSSAVSALICVVNGTLKGCLMTLVATEMWDLVSIVDTISICQLFFVCLCVHVCIKQAFLATTSLLFFSANWILEYYTMNPVEIMILFVHAL